METDFDLIIIGGGCAGLSLALRLARLGLAAPKTLVLERRSAYSNDRTWCFWSKEHELYPNLVQHCWKQMSVQAEGRRIVMDCAGTPYQMIPAASFYAHALEEINKSTQVSILMDTHFVVDPAKVNQNWEIETRASSYRSRYVIDTRPPRNPAASDSILWQSFLGQEIECEEAVFEPQTVDLMNFMPSDSASPPKSSRAVFSYLLPFSPRRALIEATVFSAQREQPDLQNLLNCAVYRQTRGAAYRIVRSESGLLPMGGEAILDTQDPSYIRVGLHSGGARASTGYAFQRIQQWADLCGQRLAEGKGPTGHSLDPFFLRAMDRIFLSVIRARPQSAPAIFLSLFGRADSARIIRFLSDRGSFGDYLAIVAALPLLPFLQQLPHALLEMAQLPRPVLSR